MKYDLATGESLGKLGKPVKSLQSQLRGYNVYEVINSFEDQNYKAYLRFVLRHFVNNGRNYKKNYRNEVNRIANVGTFLSRIGDNSYFEQYFAAGIHTVHPTLNAKLSDIPRQLMDLVKKHGLMLDNGLIRTYNDNPYVFKAIIELECNSLTIDHKYRLLDITRRTHYATEANIIEVLKTEYGYNIIPLIKYIDHLITYEALSLSSILDELKDYCRMMSKISAKYDKYPRNLLTTHRIATRNYERLNKMFSEILFEKRIDTSLEWTVDGFSIIHPKTTEEIKDEAAQQNNCVASYIDSVIKGDCNIVFLRSTESKDKSLVTMEVRHNKVVQAKGKFNRELTDHELKIVQKYNVHLERMKTPCTKIDSQMYTSTQEMIAC